MNEFAINWIKGADYAEITVPSGTALKIQAAHSRDFSHGLAAL